MASRMDRYSSDEVNIKGRSDRNKSLYKEIEDMDSYTNIAGIATIENKNSIDLNSVKELLKSKERQEKQVNIKESNEQIKEIEDVKVEQEKYDINELLAKMKEKNKNNENKYRSLSEKQREILKDMNEKNRKKQKSKEINYDEIDELVKTISNMNPLNDDDDVGLLDDLKSDTMVGDVSSIKKIIDEEKDLTSNFDDMKMDKSFYTSSFGFTQKDFEELKDMNHKIKKDNKFIITLLIILIILIIIGAIIFIIK